MKTDNTRFEEKLIETKTMGSLTSSISPVNSKICLISALQPTHLNTARPENSGGAGGAGIVNRVCRGESVGSDDNVPVKPGT